MDFEKFEIVKNVTVKIFYVTRGNQALILGFVFISVKRSVTLRCKFKSNSGSAVKLYNVFANEGGNSRFLSRYNNQIFISACEFEVNEKASSSLFYVHRSTDKYEQITATAVDCIFTGKLSKEAHHIDGTIVDEKKKTRFNQEKFVLKSCKFTDSQEKAANANIASFDTKSVIFNYDENIKNNSKSSYLSIWNVPVVPLLFVVSVAALYGVVITLFRRKSDNNQEEENNEISLSLI